MQVRQWNLWGLPKDDLSTENAIAIDVGKCAQQLWWTMPYV